MAFLWDRDMFTLEGIVPAERQGSRVKKGGDHWRKKTLSSRGGCSHVVREGEKWRFGGDFGLPFSLPSLPLSTGCCLLTPSGSGTSSHSSGKPWQCPPPQTPGRNLISYWNPEVLEALCATPENEMELSSIFPIAASSLIFPWSKRGHLRTVLLFDELFANDR